MPQTQDMHSIKIGVFKLERQDQIITGQYTACVVAAAHEQAAREIANAESGEEGYIWRDGHQVAATRLGDAAADIAGILLWSKE